MAKKDSNLEARKNARESFMQLLYEMEINNDYSRQLKERFISQCDRLQCFDLSYFNKMFDTINSYKKEIDQVLSDSSTHWKLDRIAKVDLAVLRLSSAEIMYFEDIPDSVSVNEAVELAKKFGSEESGKFVNGILGKVVRGKNGS